MPWERESILAFVTAAARATPPGARVLDVGAGDAPYRELFAHAEYLTADWEHSPHEGARPRGLSSRRPTSCRCRDAERRRRALHAGARARARAGRGARRAARACCAPGGRLYLTVAAGVGAARAAARLLPLHTARARASARPRGLRRGGRATAQRLLHDARPADAQPRRDDGPGPGRARRAPRAGDADARRAGRRRSPRSRRWTRAACCRSASRRPRRPPSHDAPAASSISPRGSTTAAPTRARSTGSSGSTASASRPR